MIASTRYLTRLTTVLTALFLLAALLVPAVRAADGKDQDKKPEKEKKEKVDPWVEIRTAHFIAASDGGEKTARRIANDFETVLGVFQATMPHAQVGTGIPVRILAARNGRSFARVAPDFPYDERHEQPAGLLTFGPEKSYLVIRANASGRFRYIDIFQQYAREILKRSYRQLPPWLEEGFSTVYGNLNLTDRGVQLARPDPNDLSVLFESPLLPVDLVLRVDRNSPYYSPGNKDSVYFAESRVLVQLLITDPQFTASKSLERYITAVQGGADSLQAARDAFGDLNQLQAKLEAFVKFVSGPPAEISVPGGNDSTSASRTLSASELAARLADFQAVRGKVEDAQDQLEEVLMNDPNVAEAEQSLGFLMLKKSNLDEAEKHFDHAAQLDPKDALNFYGKGLVAVARSADGNAPAGAAEAFETATALSPDFAPAWYNLALVFAQRNETLPKALAAAQRAAALAPGEKRYQSQVAEILDRKNHPEQARTVAARAPESSIDRSASGKAVAVSAPTAAAVKPSSDSAPRMERKTEPAAPATASAPVPPLFSESAQVYSMVGTISEVNCANAPQVQLTLKSQAIVMKLHADNFAQLAAKTASCSGLRGHTARISYVFVSGKAWDAEMRTLEFRSQP